MCVRASSVAYTQHLRIECEDNSPLLQRFQFKFCRDFRILLNRNLKSFDRMKSDLGFEKERFHQLDVQNSIR